VHFDSPEFEDGVMDIFAKKKNLRVMRIENIARLQEFASARVVDFKSLIDGGMIVQWSYEPKTLKREDFLPATATWKDKEYKVERQPTDAEYDDLLFGWLVEAGEEFLHAHDYQKALSCYDKAISDLKEIPGEEEVVKTLLPVAAAP